MISRSSCICDGEIYGIEYVYTVVDGKKINDREHLKWMRKMGQENKLICPCGCGAHLIVVAGERNLVEQHFRVKKGESESACTYKEESQNSQNAKLVLWLWLKDKFANSKVSFNKSLSEIANCNRRFKVSFFLEDERIGVNYTETKGNLSDEKVDVIEETIANTPVFYFSSMMTSNKTGQMPEALIRIQEKQKYCLLLENADGEYEDAFISVQVYHNELGYWECLDVCKGLLSEFTIENDQMMYCDLCVADLAETKLANRHEEIEALREKYRLEEEHRKQERLKREAEERIQKQVQDRILEEKRKTLLEMPVITTVATHERSKTFFVKPDIVEDLNTESNAEKIKNQNSPAYTAYGTRIGRCFVCEKILSADKFAMFSYKGHINEGFCRDCVKENSERYQEIYHMVRG